MGANGISLFVRQCQFIPQAIHLNFQSCNRNFPELGLDKQGRKPSMGFCGLRGEGSSCVLAAQLCPTLCDPTDYIVHQSPLSLGFSSQENWIGSPFPSPGNIPKPGIEPRVSSPAGRCFTICDFLGLL